MPRLRIGRQAKGQKLTTETIELTSGQVGVVTVGLSKKLARSLRRAGGGRLELTATSGETKRTATLRVR